MLLNEPTPHPPHQTTATAAAPPSARGIPPLELDAAARAATAEADTVAFTAVERDEAEGRRDGGESSTGSAGSNGVGSDAGNGVAAGDGAGVSASGAEPESGADSDAISTVSLDVDEVKRATASDATATVSLNVAAIKQAMREGNGFAQAPTIAFAPVKADAEPDAETGAAAAAAAADSGDPSSASDAAATGPMPSDVSADLAAADLDPADSTGTEPPAAGTLADLGPAGDADIKSSVPDIAAADFDRAGSAEPLAADLDPVVDADTGPLASDASADIAADNEPLAADASTDLEPTADTTPDTDPATPAFLASTDLSVPTSTIVAVPTTADDVIATIHAAATVVAAADRRAREAAVVKEDPWTGLDLRQAPAPAPVDNVLDLLAPVLERPLLVVEQPGLPDAADVVALHRSELEADFVEPPVVAAGAEPAIPPRYGPGLSVLPHIEFPV